MAGAGTGDVNNAIQVIQTSGRAFKNDEQTESDINAVNTLSQNVQQDPTFRYSLKMILF